MMPADLNAVEYALVLLQQGRAAECRDHLRTLLLAHDRQPPAPPTIGLDPPPPASASAA